MARLCVVQLYDKRRRHQSHFFVPTCLEDGTFAPVQCHPETGYCWCVTPSGKPIPNSSLRHARPNCTRRGEDQLRIESTKESPRIASCNTLNCSEIRTAGLQQFASGGSWGQQLGQSMEGEKKICVNSFVGLIVRMSIVCCSHGWKTNARNSETG